MLGKLGSESQKVLVSNLEGVEEMPNRAAKQRKMDRRNAHDAIKKRKRAIRKAKKQAREVADA